MQYMLLIAREDSVMTESSPEERDTRRAAFLAYTRALREAGLLLGGDALEPSTTARTVRVRGGQARILDGPFADSKEQLGGYYLIDAPDMDTAVAWAARCPAAAFGAMEVRPVMFVPKA